MTLFSLLNIPLLVNPMVNVDVNSTLLVELVIPVLMDSITSSLDKDVKRVLAT